METVDLFFAKIPHEIFGILISINLHSFCDFCRLMKLPGTRTSNFNK